MFGVFAQLSPRGKAARVPALKISLFYRHGRPVWIAGALRKGSGPEGKPKTLDCGLSGKAVSPTPLSLSPFQRKPAPRLRRNRRSSYRVRQINLNKYPAVGISNPHAMMPHAPRPNSSLTSCRLPSSPDCNLRFFLHSEQPDFERKALRSSRLGNCTQQPPAQEAGFFSPPLPRNPPLPTPERLQWKLLKPLRLFSKQVDYTEVVTGVLVSQTHEN